MSVKMVWVKLKDNYLPHLNTREIEMYQGPAEQLEEAGVVEIMADKKPDKPPQKSGKHK